MSIYFIPIVTLLGAALFRYRSIRALVALSRPAGSIRAFGYGYCPLGNTPSRSPYFAVAQYGRLATAIGRWAIRLRGRPISPCGLNTGSCRPGLRYAYPGLYSGAPSGRSISPFPNLTSAAGRCQFPAPNLTSAAGRCQFPRPKPHICRRQMSIPPLNLWRGSQGVRSMTGSEVTG